MNAVPPAWRRRLLPRSLFGRLIVILCAGLLCAHTLSFGLIVYERAQAAKTMMLFYLGKDVASSLAILERVPAGERAGWLPRLERGNYRYVLGMAPAGAAPPAGLASEIVAAISAALDPRYAVNATVPPSAAPSRRLDVGLTLSDGAPLTIEIIPSGQSLSPWLLLILSGQLLLLAGCTWLAVRQATQPLTQLAQAANALKADMPADPLPEDGPLEVARAAGAFNAMRRRIAEALAERMQILAAISHDLQTPITRMQLRVDLMDDAQHRDKLSGDLQAMHMLVKEGIAYARNAHGIAEAPCRTNLDALLLSLVYDYLDAGRTVTLLGELGHPLTTRPHALRRIITNLLDNALKFARDVELHVSAPAPGRVAVSVRDRGPGIAPEQLGKVLLPFYRVENSRNRDTGGTGLGLTIAAQLAGAMGATLVLSPRDGGGLDACLTLPSGN